MLFNVFGGAYAWAMRVLVLLFMSTALCACADWPDLGPSEVAQDGHWPELLPFDAFDDGRGSRIDEGDAEALAARAAGLRGRAAILRRPVVDDDAFEEMRARMARF